VNISLLAALVLVAATWGYGAARLSQSAFVPGPRMALIQGNYPTSLKHDPNAFNEITRNHYAMSRQTTQYHPDVIVWPETMFRFPIFQAEPSLSDQDLAKLIPQVPAERWRDGSVERELKDLASATNASLVIGIDTFVAMKEGYEHFNSASFVTPGNGVTDRYDKLHRVPFGEYIPLRKVLPILQWFSPFGDDFGIAAGIGVHVFQVKEWRLLPLICFEDTVPQLVRSMSSAGRAEGPIDVFVNLTNDGWFHGSSELDQHLITATFRCIENRTPMVRAVNTGISAFIDGNGQVRDPEVIIDLDAIGQHDRKPRMTIRDPQTGRFYKQWNAAFISDVPLDPRESIYSKTGDVFAGLCATLCLMLAVAGMFQPRSAVAAPEAAA
jgi:apolipoprotein N-acyltransferase